MTWKCLKCGTANLDYLNACRTCGTGKDGNIKDAKQFEERESSIEQQNVSQAVGDKSKYPALHLYAGILQVIGWIAVVIGFIIAMIGMGSFIGISYGYDFASITGGVGMILAGFVLIAVGQLIYVWMDTEENTRKTADLLIVYLKKLKT